MGSILDQPDIEHGTGPNYLMKLDIGVENQRDGRILIEDLFKQHIEDNSVFDIECHHVITHVPNLKLFMEECWRILIPHGHLYIFAPYFTSLEAVQDHRHVNRITENTFYAFSKKKYKEIFGMKQDEMKIDFETLHIRYYYNEEYKVMSDEAREYARRHYFNVVKIIEVDLKAIK
jgi:SAM-dependent methyltransferase